MSNKTVPYYEFVIFSSLIIVVLLLSVFNLNATESVVLPETQVLGDSSGLYLEREYWKNIVIIHPTYFPGWVGLATIEKELGNIDASEKAYAQAIEIFPNSQNFEDLLIK